MEYVLHLVVILGIYAILGLSLNLVVGYTGLLSIAHGAFFGIGAYASAILLESYGWNFLPALIASVSVTMVIAALIGFVLSKFRGDYYALASLGFSVIAYAVFLNWRSLTGGAFGITGIDRPELFGMTFTPGISYTLLIITVVAIVYLLCQFITESSFGRVLKAIREDEEAIEVFGYKTTLFKLAIFVTSAGFAALAGSLFASYVSFISPGAFVDMVSIYIVVIVILGGLASHDGALLGAAVYILLPELLRFVGLPDSIAGHARQAIYGLGLILLMFYRPQGILGKFRL